MRVVCVWYACGMRDMGAGVVWVWCGMGILRAHYSQTYPKPSNLAVTDTKTKRPMVLTKVFMSSNLSDDF